MSPPFDAKKYEALMGGLEAIEVRLSKTQSSSTYFRLEAEYFISKIASKGMTGSDVVAAVDYGTSDALNEIQDGYPVLRLNEIDNMFIRTPAKYCSTLSETKYEFLRLKKGDVVICRTNGNPNLVGKCAVVLEDTVYAFASYCFRVRTNNILKPTVLVAYLSGHFGRMEIDKHSMKGNQTNFSPAKFKDISIPKFGETIQNKIDTIICQAYSLRLQAESLYSTAETLLLSALGMTNFVPSEENVTVKLLSESFGTTGRLDAEFYQPKYEDLHKRLSQCKCKKLGDIVSILKSIEPGSEYYGDDGVPFVRVSDLTKFGISPPAIKIPISIGQPSLYPKRDTILLSKDGTVGIAYKVEHDTTCVTSGALLHLTVKNDVLPDYLTLLLNSPIVQLQAERDAGGSIIQHWKPSEIADVVIPILDTATQQKIVADVQRSFALRRESEQLLDSAKRAVEIAIEENEEAAVKWLHSIKMPHLPPRP